LVDSHCAWDVFFALERLYLGQHHFLVLSHSFINHSSNQVLVGLTHTKSDSRLNQFDEALNKQLLHKLGVAFLVVSKLISHAEFGLIEEALDQLVGCPHFGDASLVSLSRALDLKVDLSDVDVLLVLFGETLLLALNLLFLLNGEVHVGLIADLLYALFSVLLDEKDHRGEDIVLLLVVHVVYRY